MLFSQKDLQGMFEPFSKVVTANKGSSSEYFFLAIFDVPHVEYGDEIQFSGQDAKLTSVKNTDADKLAIGQRVYVCSKSYRIADIQPDGTNEGYSKLELKQ